MPGDCYIPRMKLIGIDLGTTYSLCSVFENGAPRLIADADGRVMTPSVVGVTADGEILVGQAAVDYRLKAASDCAWCFKRLMGTDRRSTLGGADFSAVDLSSLVLRKLADDAEAALGERPEAAVISVPAYFNDLQRKATRAAGEAAGLTVRRIINEPTAAALTYGFHDRDENRTVIVIDLGGGTFDVTVMEIFEGSLEIYSTAGESFLGGEDFTREVFDHAAVRSGLDPRSVWQASPLLAARLLTECEAAKRRLTDAESTEISVPDAEGVLTSSMLELTRDQLVSLTASILARLQRPIDKALRDVSLRPSDIDDIILVGGATRMPMVQEFLRRYFKREPLCQYDPDHVVALGAAVQTALIEDDRSVADLVMTDVCPFTLGIRIPPKFDNKDYDSGAYLPVIPRNTTIPVRKKKIIASVEPICESLDLDIDIYQGEHRQVERNIKLGELRVVGIPPATGTLELELAFGYDLNGELNVAAEVMATGERYSMTIRSQ
jgi:molecular chaperone HscC